MAKPALSINGHEITTKQFADRLALRLKPYDALSVKDENTLERAKEDTVQVLVLEMISRDYAVKQSLKVTPSEVETMVEEIRSKYPDDFAFRRALSTENLSLEAWRADLEYSLLQKKIFAKVTTGLAEPTELELKTYYESNRALFHRPARIRLRQIVLEKEDDARRIYDQLARGASLESLAKQYSVAPEAAKGGDTGWLDKGTLDIFDQGFKMAIGARSRVLKSPYGWHIFEVLKKEPEAHLSFIEAKDKIRAQLMETKAQAAYSSWMEEQVRKSSIKRNDAVIRAIQVSTRGS